MPGHKAVGDEPPSAPTPIPRDLTSMGKEKCQVGDRVRGMGVGQRQGPGGNVGYSYKNPSSESARQIPMADSPRDPPIVSPPIRLAVCVSWGGTTLQNLIDLIRHKKLRAQIVQVVASRPRIEAIPKAEAAGIPLAL